MVVAAIAAAACAPSAAGAAVGDLAAVGCIVDSHGRETCAQKAPGLDKPLELALSPDGTSAYAASQLSDAVVRFNRDPATGDLDPAGCVAEVGSPTRCARTTAGLDGAGAAAVSPDGRWLYVVGRHALVRFKRNPVNGAISPVECLGGSNCDIREPGLNGGAGIAVTADGGSIYVSSSADDAIVELRRKANGALLSRGCTQDAGTANPVCARFAEGLDGARSLLLSPDEKSLYVASTSSFAVTTFSRAANGRLTQAGCIADDDLGSTPCGQTSPALAVPLGLALSPDGTSLYATSHLDAAVTLLSRDPASGALTPAGCFEAPGGADSCTALTTGPLFPTGIVAGPEGDTLYVASGQGDAILTLARGAGGSLSFDSCIEDNRNPDFYDCGQLAPGLNGAASFTLSDDGGHLYTTSREDTITQFLRDTGS